MYSYTFYTLVVNYFEHLIKLSVILSYLFNFAYFRTYHRTVNGI